MNWIRQLFRRRRLYGDLSDEIQEHLEEKIEELVAGGMSREDATRAARREFGNVTLLEQRSREVWQWPSIENFFMDVRFGLRMLRKNPGFSAVAILTLALGIGATTATFSLLDGILLRSLPFVQPDRLVSVTDSYPQGALVAMRAKLHSMEVGGYADGQELNLTGLGDPERLYGTAVSANLFSLLGARPELGRIFSPGEDQPGRDNLVILSHALWLEKFGGDPGVVGRSVALEGESRHIVGVMPAGFEIASSKAQFWIPLDLDPRAVGSYWGGGFMPVVGSLRPGVTLEQARAELEAHIPRMRAMFPWKMPDSIWASSTVIPLDQSLAGEVRTKLLLLLGAASLVLLIACANTANLLLARATVRQKEMAVRAALGAGRWRICRQLLTEGLILAVSGGALGTLAAVDGLAWLKAILPPGTPRLAAVRIDWSVLAFTAGIAILTGLLFGILPALHASRTDLTGSLKTGRQHSTESSRWLRSGLAVAEMALGVVLVTAAALTARSLWELSRIDPGFRSESILTARITPNQAFCADFARCRGFYDRVIESTRALPGVNGAAAVNVLPLGGRINAYAADVEEHRRDPKDPAPVIFETIATPDYRQVMGIPLLRGRDFTRADMAPDAPPVALVTASTARRFWPNQDPIGKHLKRAWVSEWTTTVVGVTADVNEYSLASKLPEFADGAVYVPYGSGAHGGTPRPTEMALVVRTANDPASLAVELRRVVSALNPEAPVSEIQTLGTVVSESAGAPRATMTLFAMFAAFALVLGAVGVYGVVSYSVAQRTPEIGVRLALGAGKHEVMRLVMRQGARLALGGAAIGIAGALALTRFLSSLLYGVTATDPATFVAVPALLVAVALVASYLPARRATKVDPMAALRHE